MNESFILVGVAAFTGLYADVGCGIGMIEPGAFDANRVLVSVTGKEEKQYNWKKSSQKKYLLAKVKITEICGWGKMQGVGSSEQ